MSMRVIETNYDGYRFRSRTEARWAVFFNHAGIRFYYEPEGLVIDGEAYLPDFFLPDAGAWFEVKGQEPTEQEAALCRKLAKETGHPCLLAVGPPDSNGGIREFGGNRWDRWPGLDDPSFAETFNYRFADDPRNKGCFWLWSADETFGFVVIKGNEWTCHEGQPDIWSATAKGYLAARAARFEHGEAPTPHGSK